MSDVPHFSLPFRFVAPDAATSEQDSLDEITDCVLAALLCPQGYRVELPPYGLPDPTFAQRVDVDEIRSTIEAWEPRAAAVLAERPDAFDELIAHVQVNVTIRTEE